MGDAQGVDWVERWRRIVEAREAQAQRLWERSGRAAGNSWDQRAEGYRSRMQGAAGDPERFLDLVVAHVTPESTVLDVGAGVGRYALPLAKLARQVVAVEPSRGMWGFLESDAAEQGLTNIRVVPRSWEEADVEPCDVALCSHVAYFVAHIQPFVEKLQQHTKAYCFIAIRTTQQDELLWELWREVHGEERSPEPGFMDLYNVLYQSLGVCANVDFMPSRSGRGPLVAGRTLEEALAEARGRLFVAEGSPEESVVRAYLGERLVEDRGRLTLPEPRMVTAIVWWDNRPESWNLMSESS